VAIGPIADPKLSAGDWRELSPKEVRMLETMQELAKPKPRRAARPAVKKTKTAGAAPAKKKPAAKRAASKKSSSSRTKVAGPRPKSPAARRSAHEARPARESRRGRG
jgi:hypothetical protein